VLLLLTVGSDSESFRGLLPKLLPFCGPCQVSYCSNRRHSLCGLLLSPVPIVLCISAGYSRSWSRLRVIVCGTRTPACNQSAFSDMRRYAIDCTFAFLPTRCLFMSTSCTFGQVCDPISFWPFSTHSITPSKFIVADVKLILQG
jgi:hypothetical protein